MTAASSVTRDRIPVPADHVETELVDNEVLLFHPRQTAAVYLNATAAMVWGLCDGVRTVADIIALLEGAYPDAGASIVADVEDAFQSLHKDGMIVLR
ncbi:MAG: PqqD family protein [Xanthobacteraceae bacterium]